MTKFIGETGIHWDIFLFGASEQILLLLIFKQLCKYLFLFILKICIYYVNLKCFPETNFEKYEIRSIIFINTFPK